VHLYNVVDQTELTAALAANHVREQTHPSEPLAILNYTELCAYGEAWNPTTLACRGLIYRTDTSEVVARGFNKFFNHGQVGAAEIALDAPVHVTDKADGSLGIVYPVPSGGWAVSTRGSFASEQAIHATEVLAKRYPDYRPGPGVTTLLEIVYPQNRIVLDYAGMDDLILLGGVEVATGVVLEPAQFPDWAGPRTQVFEAATFADALAMEPRPNAEGIVVRDLTSGGMVKLKQADYVALHRIVTNLTARKIHEWMVEGKPLADFIAPLPDEFHAWCRQTAEGIAALVDAEDARLGAAFAEVVDQVIATHVGWRPGDRAARKDFAMIAAQHPDKWALFALLDQRDIRPGLLKRAQPAPFLTPTGRTYTEDNA
jgi:RNA ligase